MAADGIAGKIKLSLLSAFIMSWCWYVFLGMVVRVAAASGAG